MAYETLVKRTIWTAKCECGSDDVKISNPPRERFCFECKKWIPYREDSAVGPDLR